MTEGMWGSILGDKPEDLNTDPAVDLAKTMAASLAAQNAWDLKTARSLTGRVEKLVAIISACQSAWDLFWSPAARTGVLVAERSAVEILAELYAEFLGADIAVVHRQISTATETAEAAWAPLAADESRIDAAALEGFYQDLPLPASCGLPMYFDSAVNLPLAIMMSMVRLAADLGARRFLDFGGNTGLATSLARGLGLPEVTLYELSDQARAFAAWRDARFGVTGIRYVGNGADLADGAHDFVLCSEVLEHLLDVETAVAALAACLRPGGVAVINPSFGLWPHPGHLARNRVFAGREDELMARHGLRRLNYRWPVPIPTTVGLYQKTA